MLRHFDGLLLALTFWTVDIDQLQVVLRQREAPLAHGADEFVQEAKAERKRNVAM